LKVKFTTHSPVCTVGPGARVGQVAAIHLDALAHRDLLPDCPASAGIVARRPVRRSRVGRLVHQVERHVRGLAEQLLDPLGIADAGQLHHDAAVALAG
jgi:hypothetical protein